MRAFLTQLAKGAFKSDIDKEHNELLKNLIKERIVKEKGEKIHLDSKYRAGVIDLLSSGIGFLEQIGVEGKDLLIEPYNLNGAKDGDYVIARRIFGKAGRPSAKVVTIVQPAFIYAVGYLKKDASKNLTAFNIKNDLPIELRTPKEDLEKMGEYTVFQVDNSTSKITKILGNLNDSNVDEQISLALFNKKEAFSDEAENEARSWGDSVDKSSYPNRTDLTHLPFCTIDPIDAKDFDDAICWDEEKHILYVAIADVSSYVTLGCAIDKEAVKRGFSIYFPHKSIPMLPRALSENICSLKPDTNRLAFVCKLSLDQNSLKVTSHQFIEAIINSKRRYNYEEIDKYFEEGFSNANKKDKITLPSIFSLKKVTQKLRKERLKTGYDFKSSEIRMQLDDDHNLISTRIEHSTPAHSLVEECMLLANKAAAEHYDFGIFRTHDAPAPQKIEKLVDDLGKIGIYVKEDIKDFHSLVLALQKEARAKGVEEYVDQLIIQSQKQAVYTPENRGHFGLGFERYTHFTSPIRRYADLTVHRLLKAIFAKEEKEKSYILRNIEPICIKISELEREATRVEFDYKYRKYARWALAHPDAVLDAVVIDTTNIPAAVTDEGILGMRLFCDRSDLLLFDHIKAKTLLVHLSTAKIIVNILEVRHLLE